MIGGDIGHDGTSLSVVEFTGTDVYDELAYQPVAKGRVLPLHLLVDDESDICNAMRLVLEKLGYRIITAADGNLGLALAEQEAPDLVIVDMMMPKKSGFLVLESLKARADGGPPVIMITGNEGARHRAYAEILGVDDYILKPFAMERLVDSVARFCPLDVVSASRES
jgi:CheY-like chemotaxis protein